MLILMKFVDVNMYEDYPASPFRVFFFSRLTATENDIILHTILYSSSSYGN